MNTEITKRTMLVAGLKGGRLDVVSADGEVIYGFDVPHGQHKASDYLALVEAGASIQIASGLVAIQPRGAVGIQAPDLLREDDGTITDTKYQSGANPHFQPMGSAEKMAEKMRREISRMTALNDATERRHRALSKIERIPSARVDDPVLEPVEPSPAPIADPLPPVADAR